MVRKLTVTICLYFGVKLRPNIRVCPLNNTLVILNFRLLCSSTVSSHLANILKKNTGKYVLAKLEKSTGKVQVENKSRL